MLTHVLLKYKVANLGQTYGSTKSVHLYTSYQPQQRTPTPTYNNTEQHSNTTHTHQNKTDVTYNTSGVFGSHIYNIDNKCRPTLNALSAFAGSTFGQTHTYTQQGIVPPVISNTQLNKLQIVQNTALWIIIGSTQTTPIEHLQAETKILTLKQHLDKRGTHFLTSEINNKDSPCYYLHPHPPTLRKIVNSSHRYYTRILNLI